MQACHSKLDLLRLTRHVHIMRRKLPSHHEMNRNAGLLSSLGVVDQ